MWGSATHRGGAGDLVEAVLESSPGPLALLDRDFDIVRANRAFAALIDGVPGQRLGGAFFAAFPNDAARAVFRRARETGERVEGRAAPLLLAVPSTDGPTWWGWTLTPTIGEAGAVTGFVLALTRATAGAAGAHDLEFCRDVVDSSDDAIFAWRLGGPIEYWNGGATKLYGYEREAAVGASARALLQSIPPEPWSAIEALLLEGGAWKGDLLQRTRDGRQVVVLASLRLLPREDGAALVVESNRDVTERRGAELRLRESEARFHAIADYTADCESWIDPGGKLLWVNPAVEELTGYSVEECLAMPDYPLPLIAPQDRETVATDLARTLATGRQAALEFRLQHKGGAIRWGEVRTQAIFDPQGRPLGHRASVRDVTARKQAEDQLREVDRRRSEFLTMLSHELRNPLAPIHNSLYVLGRAAPGGEQARRAQAVIARQVDHLTRLVEDLLDVTRITRGQVLLQREPLDLCELVLRTVDDYRGAFADGGIEICTALTPDQAWVRGDRVRLAQVVGNLLQNAAKFTPRGGKVTVSVEADDARRLALIRAQDTGRGVPPEMLPRLFEAFSQADATLDRKAGGLGLGLSLVKGLVELHGGSVTAASQGIGRGAEFTIRLPLEPRPTAAREEPHRDARVGPPRRILVIEDNVDAADSLRDVLELYGHEVVVTYDGSTGLERVRALRPDVVLCDIGLPGMDGYAVARALRADPELCRVTLVALTGYAGPEDVAKATAAGFDAHVPKPPTFDALGQVLAHPRAGAK